MTTAVARRVNHEVPMLSIDSTRDADELRNFDGRIKQFLGVRQIDYVVELKIDGVALTVLYANGRLILAGTRGNGLAGHEITSLVETIPGVPAEIAAESCLEVRGEIYMTKDEAARLNAAREAAGETPFSTPRNAAGGTLNVLDPIARGERRLSAFFYGVAGGEPEQARYHHEILEGLAGAGFPVNPHSKRVLSIEAAIEFAAVWAEKRHELPYDVDGIVVKVDSLELQARLGATKRAPRYMMAFKWNDGGNA
jgi:DNA ligase (NAD+)